MDKKTGRLGPYLARFGRRLRLRDGWLLAQFGPVHVSMHPDNLADFVALAQEALAKQKRPMCTQCNGSGEGPADRTFCPECGGSGRVAA